jgi:Domain of unknown function (DUF4407)
MSQLGETAEYEYPPVQRRRRLGDLLIALSGARPEILARCPTERIKFQSLGWAILITCAMATVSMWFALTSALGINPVGALPVALLWGLIIMGIDRWLVTSMPIDGRRKFFVAAPRVVLALLLGSLISTPIVLRIFESEINNQISIIKDTNEANFLNSQQHSSIQGRITQWQSTVNNLEQVIDSHGAKAINPASDPVVQGLTTQLNTERTVAKTDYQAWQCQLYGGCGAPKGNGQLAQASQKRYDADEQQITSLTSQIQSREQSLQASDVDSQANRLQQAQSALPNAQAQLKAAQGEEDELLGGFQDTNNATDGILIRLKALDQLSAGDSTLQLARLLLFLLFLVIEILPVTVKLLQQPGNYEKILKTVTRKELNQAQWDLRGGPGRGHGSAADDDALRPTAADAGPGGRRGRGLRRSIDDELKQLFAQRTRTDPAPGWQDSAATSGYAQLPVDATGPNRLDDVVRGMKDTRRPTGGDSGPRGGDGQGIGGLYRDEDY